MFERLVFNCVCVNFHICTSSLNLKPKKNSSFAFGSAALTLERLQALACLDIPDFDGGVCVAWDQNVVFELHAAGEGLVAC